MEFPENETPSMKGKMGTLLAMSMIMGGLGGGMFGGGGSGRMSDNDV